MNELEFLWIMARLLVISSAISLVGAVFELGKLDREIIENQKNAL